MVFMAFSEPVSPEGLDPSVEGTLHKKSVGSVIGPLRAHQPKIAKSHTIDIRSS